MSVDDLDAVVEQTEEPQAHCDPMIVVGVEGRGTWFPGLDRDPIRSRRNDRPEPDQFGFKRGEPVGFLEA